jgi:hypothetical protein
MYACMYARSYVRIIRMCACVRARERVCVCIPSLPFGHDQTRPRHGRDDERENAHEVERDLPPRNWFLQPPPPPHVYVDAHGAEGSCQNGTHTHPHARTQLNHPATSSRKSVP